MPHICNTLTFTADLSQLHINDLEMVQDELAFIDTKWHNIGLELGFHPDTLNEIHLQNSANRSCLQEVLERWLKMVNPPPTWEALAKALERTTVGEYQKAQKLREKYCQYQKARCDGHDLPTTTNACHKGGEQQLRDACYKHQETAMDLDEGPSAPIEESCTVHSPIKRQHSLQSYLDTELENQSPPKRPKSKIAVHMRDIKTRESLIDRYIQWMLLSCIAV